MFLKKLSTLGTAALIVFGCGVQVAAFAATAGDACSYLSKAQVSAAAGASVSDGAYVTPTFKKTCTWTATGMIITLNLQDVAFFQASKHPPVPAVVVTPLSGIGDEAYFITTGPQVVLIARKGNTAFKVSAYLSDAPAEKKQAVEKTLAAQVMAGMWLP